MIKSALPILLLFSSVALPLHAMNQAPDSLSTAGHPSTSPLQASSPDSIPDQTLNEVVVKGEKSQIKSRDGSMIVDLPSIVKDKPVSNILEALTYLPGVTSDGGMLSLAGAGTVSIILNGEPTDMPIETLCQLLYSMPIDKLKNVEIMYAAPAKYHVKGAVINVILKTPTPLDGLQGQLRAGYEQTHRPTYGAGAAATYAIKKWTFDMNYSLRDGRGKDREVTRSNHLVDGTRHLIEEDNSRISRKLSNLIYASAAYSFSKKSNLKLTYNGQFTSRSKNLSHTTGTLGQSLNTSTYQSPISFHYAAIRYTTPFGLAAGGEFSHYSERRHQYLQSLSPDAPVMDASNRQRVSRTHVYADMTHQINGLSINYGSEYTTASDHSRQSFLLPENPGFNSTLNEKTVQVYAGMQGSFPFGLSLAASLAGEYYHNASVHNWDFVPQLGATYYRTPTSIFQLSFFSERVYPSYWELHGATGYLNPYSIVVGNPNLLPTLKYSGQFSYIFRQKYVATLYVKYNDRASVQLPYQSPTELQLIYQTVNMDYARTVGLHLHIPLELKSVLNSTITANLFNQRAKADHFHDISFDNSRWTFYGELNNTLRFTPTSPIAISLDISCITPSIQGIADLTGLWRMDAGIKWSFARKRCCELNLKCNDIFNTWSPTLSIDTRGQDYRMKVIDMTRSLNLTLVYRFNGFKPHETDIDTSRFGTGK